MVKTAAKMERPADELETFGKLAERDGSNQPRDIMIVENLNRATLKIIAKG